MRRVALLALASCLLVAAVGALVTKSDAAPAAKHAITPAPAFTAAELNAPAGNNWLSHMGNLPGWRYSSLTQINKSNVATLKEAWHINLGTCPPGRRTPRAAPSRRTQSSTRAPTTSRPRRARPSRSTPRRAAASGSTRPTFESRLQRRHRWPQPGVAVGEGKVFNGPRDGRLVALDQVTGKRSGRPRSARTEGQQGLHRSDLRQRHRPRRRLAATAAAPAPRSRLQGRQRRQALDLDRDPGPGPARYKTWPTNDRQGRLYGGGSFWESPIVDTKRSLRSSARATRSRGTRAARARTSTPTRSSR